MFTNFSVLPLRLAVALGFGFALIGFVGGIKFFVEKLSDPTLPAGWASLIVSVYILSGVQLLAIGMVGEYLGRLFMMQNGNQQFIVRKSLNITDEHDAD